MRLDPEEQSLHISIYYDPYGRVGRIVPPDGVAHEVDFDYKGVRLVNRTVQVATSLDCTEEASTTSESYDPLGTTSGIGCGTNGAIFYCDYDSRGCRDQFSEVFRHLFSNSFLVGSAGDPPRVRD